MLELASHASRIEDDVWLRRADGSRFQADVTLIPLDTPDGVRVITTPSTTKGTDRVRESRSR